MFYALTVFQKITRQIPLSSEELHYIAHELGLNTRGKHDKGRD